MLVALTLGAIVIVAAGALHSAVRTLHALHDAGTRLQESGSVLIAVLARHAALAGYADLTRSASSTRTFADRFGVPAVLGCDRGALTTHTATTPAACSPDSTGNDSVLFRYQALPDPADAAATLPGYDAARGLGADCLGQGPGDGSLLAVSHFRVQSGVLHCLGNGNPGRSQPLFQGVEQMRVRYLVDIDGDGNGDTWLAASDPTLATAAGWARVLALEVCVRLRSDDPVARPSRQAIETCDGGTRTVSDGRLRRTFRTVVALLNQRADTAMIREGALP